MILVVHEPRVKAPVRWTFAVGNFDDNKNILGKKFHLTVLQATPEQTSQEPGVCTRCIMLWQLLRRGYSCLIECPSSGVGPCTFDRQSVRVWIGDIPHGHSPVSETFVQRRDFAGMFLKCSQKWQLTPDFRLPSFEKKKSEPEKRAIPYPQPFHTLTRLPPGHVTRP